MSTATGDLLAVSKAAQVGGTLFINPVNAGAAKPGDNSVTVLTATSLTATAPGGASPLVMARPASSLLTLSFSTTPTSIIVTYGVDFAPDSFGESGNPYVVGHVLDDLQESGASAAFNAIAPDFFTVGDDLELAHQYDTLSGEGTAAAQSTAFHSASLIGDAARQQAESFLFSTPLSPKAGEVTDPTLWAVAYGGFGGLKGSRADQTADVSSSGAGLSGGFHHTVGDRWLLGAMAGFDRSTLDVPDRLTEGHIYGFHVGGYALGRAGPLYGFGLVSGDFFKNDLNRQAVAVGQTEALSSSFSSRAISARVESGWRIKWRGTQLAPFVGAQASWLYTDGYTERDAGGPSLFALAFQPHVTKSVQSDIGVTINGQLQPPGGATLQPQLRLDWRHEFHRDRMVAPSFSDFGSSPFMIQGASPPADIARVEAGLTFSVGTGMSAFVSYSGQFGDRAFVDSATVGFRKSW